MKKLTVQEILEEGKKTRQLPVGKDTYVDFINPTKREADELEKEAANLVNLERQRRKLLNPTPTPDEKEALEEEMKNLKNHISSELILWKGLNKVDPSVTREMMKDMSSIMLTGLELTLVGDQLGDISEERLGKLKSLRGLKRDLE